MKGSRRNILIFPAGTEIGLEIYSSLKDCKEVALFGAGQAVPNHAEFMLPEYHVLPSIHEEGWLVALVDLVRRLEIDYIFPAYDDVIVALSEARQEIPAVVLTSTSETCAITRSKSATYRSLLGRVRVPRLYQCHDAMDFPVLVKPDRGQGSQHVYLVHSPDELRHALAKVPDPIVCEYLPGEEYTVDCFSDRERGVLFAGARVRRRIRNGIAVNTATVELPEAGHIARSIAEVFELRGAWFFQLKRGRDGELTLLEVAPRLAGSMAAHRVSGVNFALLSIYEHERLPYRIEPLKTEVVLDRALANRYKHAIAFCSLYIDLDDTVICNGEVNLAAMRLIFHCLNRGKRVVLITRHSGDLAATLSKYRLNGLFDQVIHVAPDARKSEQITDAGAILVDDSFAERMEVAHNCGIPTFDLSMIELLL